MLKTVLKELKTKQSEINYRIPGVWNGNLSKKEIVVEPYSFISRKIEDILKYSNENLNYSKPLSLIKDSKKNQLKSSIFYSVLLRTTTSYPHSGKFKVVDENGYKNTGTLLKTIPILPYLKSMGVNVLYLLPISKYSNNYKKGEIGSPYAVKNFLKIDFNLQDPLIDLSAEEQFKALVEACHILDIKVVLDFVLRTAARDNELILEHPDWFYWIKTECEKEYKPPKIEELGFVQPSVENLKIVYENKNTIKHLKAFSLPPNFLNKERWDKFVKINKNNPDFIDEIKKEFKVITPPGFSDWINDNQPLWNDVTFLRLYLSHPEEALKYINKNQPPYVLFDVIKASKFPAKVKNEGLWEYISDIIPYYQKNYGIDGARIDMGHALPKELEERIMSKARNLDSEFIFIAEELEMSNDKKARAGGYDLILGNSWWSEPRIDEGEMENFITKTLPRLSLPTFGTSETPDTPRSVVRKYGKRFSKFSAVINAFLPNAVEFINSGFEFFERQPMNLGLDNTENGRYVLDKEDEFYGKLAFFDNYCLHWKNEFDVYKILKYCNKTKKEHSDTIKTENLRTFNTGNDNLLSVHYQNAENGLLIIINKNFNSPQKTNIRFEALRLLEDYRIASKKVKGEILLKPGEVSVFEYDVAEKEKTNSVLFKVEEDCLIPQKKYYSDAGWDLKAKENEILKPGESKLIPTGVYCSIPEGYVGFVKPRSGLAVRHSIDTMAGVIDSDYRGEIKIVLINHGKEEFEISKGDRIAQLVIVRILLNSEIVDNLNETSRNSKGFGSTGRR